MDLSIVIVYSTEEEDILRQCFDALCKSRGLPQHEIILVNNGKRNIAFMGGFLEGVRIIDNPVNVGIAKARSQGIKLTQSSVILFLEPDLLVHEKTISDMYEFLTGHPDVDVLAPKIVLPDGRLQYNSGDLPSILYPVREILMPFLVGRRELAVGRCQFAGTGGMMVKREAWIKTGEYDESFFYGFEDTDWCKRAYSKGVRLFYYPEAEMLHLLHQSSRAGNARQTDFYASEVHYFRKHHGKLVGSLVKLFIIAFSSIRLAALFLMPGKRESRKIVKDLIGKVVRA